MFPAHHGVCGSAFLSFLYSRLLSTVRSRFPRIHHPEAPSDPRNDSVIGGENLQNFIISNNFNFNSFRFDLRRGEGAIDPHVVRPGTGRPLDRPYFPNGGGWQAGRFSSLLCQSDSLHPVQILAIPGIASGPPTGLCCAGLVPRPITEQEEECGGGAYTRYRTTRIETT